MATFAGVLNSPGGKDFIRRQIKVHYDSNGKTDGFLVTLYDRGVLGDVRQRQVFVQDVYETGVAERLSTGDRTQREPSFTSVYEAAWGQIHPGGTRFSVPFGGITAGLHGIAYEALTGLGSDTVFPTTQRGMIATTVPSGSAPDTASNSDTPQSSPDADQSGATSPSPSSGQEDSTFPTDIGFVSLNGTDPGLDMDAVKRIQDFLTAHPGISHAGLCGMGTRGWFGGNPEECVSWPERPTH